MKNFLNFIFIFALGWQAWATAPRAPGPEAVTGFDASKYLGVWYEIGSIPKRFSRGCVCTRASYSDAGNGKIGVINECRKQSPQASLSQVNGKARFVGPSDVADLEVSFFLGIWGSYRVIALDKVNYQWSLVSSSDGKSLWILSRSPEMNPRQIDSLLAEARRKGVDTSDFQMQIQEGCWH